MAPERTPRAALGGEQARGRGPVRGLSSLSLLVFVAVAVAGCASGEVTQLRRASKATGRAVGRGDAAGVRAQMVPGARSRLDPRAFAGEGTKLWGQALKRPEEARPQAVLFLTPEDLVAVEWTPEGWRFSVDPTDVYAQATPRQALRAFVRASRAGRYDVLLQLAPRRYRVGLSVERLEKAWTQGERAKVLKASRDRLAEHLADPIVADAHEAALDMGDEHVARLEREGDRWVVVDL